MVHARSRSAELVDWYYVAVILPASDNRLMSFERWLRQKNPKDYVDHMEVFVPEFAGVNWRAQYIYSGHIEPRRIKGAYELHVAAAEEELEAL